MADAGPLEVAPAPDRVLDLRGLSCPFPLLRARRALDGMAAGQILRVEATDPHSAMDAEAFCAGAGHRLVARDRDGGVFVFLIRRG